MRHHDVKHIIIDTKYAIHILCFDCMKDRLGRKLLVTQSEFCFIQRHKHKSNHTLRYSTIMSPPIIIDSIIMPSPTRRSRRTKQVSSINDMFADENFEESRVATMRSDDEKVLKPRNSVPYTTDTITLKDMALRLRRAKRSLFLSAVSQDRPVSPSESLRTIMTHLSSSEFMMSSSASMDDGSSIMGGTDGGQD